MSVVDSELFRTDVLKRAVDAALSAPAFPQAAVDAALHADGVCNGRSPSVSAAQRAAVREAAAVIATYRAAYEREHGDGAHDTAYQRVLYQLCGCHILLGEPVLARTRLEALARQLRPPRACSTMGRPSKAQLELNVDVLGSLQWLCRVQGGAANSEDAGHRGVSQRYGRWREETLARLSGST
ncbi:hypothetical protein MSPP1_002315 [Malassezia sp. CBS 17886]|nr:hypothetical protein MSPP1_002315 [Malassezia sp. CBS 17886]